MYAVQNDIELKFNIVLYNQRYLKASRRQLLATENLNMKVSYCKEIARRYYIYKLFS